MVYVVDDSEGHVPPVTGDTDTMCIPSIYNFSHNLPSKSETDLMSENHRAKVMSFVRKQPESGNASPSTIQDSDEGSKKLEIAMKTRVKKEMKMKAKTCKRSLPPNESRVSKRPRLESSKRDGTQVMADNQISDEQTASLLSMPIIETD